TPGPAPGPVDNGPKKKTPMLRYVGVGTAVVGAAVFGMGTYYGLQAKSISDEITNHPMNEPWRADIKDFEAEGKSDEKKQIICMVGGGLALAAGVTMFIVGAPKAEAETSTSLSIAPIATPDQLGFVAAGRF